MNFKQYLTESEKEFNFRIKTITELTPDLMKKIENYLHKFRLKTISKPSKTIMQRQPLDFDDISNAEVHIFDITTSLPVSSYILQQDIRNILNIPEKYIVVRGENEPIELDSSKLNQEHELATMATDAGLVRDSLLGTDSEYPEAEHTADGSNYFGNSYNNRLLAYMKTIQDENQPLKIEAKDSLFSWLDQPTEQEPIQPPEDFNAAINNPEIKPFDKGAKKPAPNGNFDDSGNILKRTYVTKKGESISKIATSNNNRKA